MQRVQRRLVLAKRDRKPGAEKRAAEQLEELYKQQQVCIAHSTSSTHMNPQA